MTNYEFKEDLKAGLEITKKDLIRLKELRSNDKSILIEYINEGNDTKVLCKLNGRLAIVGDFHINKIIDNMIQFHMPANYKNMKLITVKEWAEHQIKRYERSIKTVMDFLNIEL